MDNERLGGAREDGVKISRLDTNDDARRLGGPGDGCARCTHALLLALDPAPGSPRSLDWTALCDATVAAVPAVSMTMVEMYTGRWVRQ
jgi:hypothetical protein